MNKQKIILITSGQPSLNPRLVKEADALSAAGYKVSVIYAYWNGWGDDFNKKLFPEKKWKTIIAGGHPVKSPFTYFMSRMIFKMARLFFYNFKMNFFADAAASRSSLFLKIKAKKHQADLYIGHNLGALPAVVRAAGIHKALCSFDAEDYHRQEITDDTSAFNYQICQHLENKYFGSLKYLSVSSPQISTAYGNIYPYIHRLTLLNVFSLHNNAKKPNKISTGPIKLFWFSQTVGAGRGLEDIALGLKSLPPQNFELHLLGYISDAERAAFITNVLLGSNNVFFHEPIPADDIVNFASQFDVGLAVENNIPFNRDICLTNKLFAYMQAGLAIVASDTTAQAAILLENGDIGQVYQKNNIASLSAILSGWYTNRQLLYKASQASLKAATEKYNWEKESEIFLSLVQNTLEH